MADLGIDRYAFEHGTTSWMNRAAAKAVLASGYQNGLIDITRSLETSPTADEAAVFLVHDVVEVAADLGRR